MTDIVTINLMFVRDGAADVVSHELMQRLINAGYVTLGRALTAAGRERIAEDWRVPVVDAPPLAPSARLTRLKRPARA